MILKPPFNSSIPTQNYIEVIEETPNGPVTINLVSRLLQQRVLMLRGEVTENSVNALIQQIIFLNSKDQEEPIKLYIDSPGGLLIHGMCLIDIMNLVEAPIHTTCIGEAASMGALILMSGEPGHRTALTNSVIMLHDSWGGAVGSFSKEQLPRAQFNVKLHEKMIQLMSTSMKMKKQKVERLILEDKWLFPEEAVALNIIDRIATIVKE